MRRNRLNEMDWDRIHDELSKDRRLKARRVTNRVNDYIKSDQYAGIYKKVKVTNKNIKQIVNDAIKRDGPNCDLNWIDTSEVTDMTDLFFKSQFSGDISNWNVSNVTNMDSMFCQSHFKGDISNWDVSNVTNMEFMFCNSQFNGDISNWNVSNVKEMNNMFSNSQFNGDISNWDVSNVENMACMFQRSKFNGDISNWDVSNVENMAFMFYDSKFNGDISNWDVGNVTNMSYMFDNNSKAIADWYMVESRKSLTNKKALYESIMKSVAKQVKKVLNESNYPEGAEYDSRAPWNQSEDVEIENQLDGVFYINNFYSTVFVNYVKYYYHSEYKNIKKLLNILIDYTGSDRAEFRYSYEKSRTVYEWENDEGIAAPVSYDTNIDYRASFADDLMIINAAKEYPEYQELFSDFVNQINEYMDLPKDSIDKDEDYDKETLIDTIVIPFEDIVDIENLDIAY